MSRPQWDATVQAISLSLIELRELVCFGALTAEACVREVERTPTSTLTEKAAGPPCLGDTAAVSSQRVKHLEAVEEEKHR
jgi:hypothetical protein